MSNLLAEPQLTTDIISSVTHTANSGTVTGDTDTDKFVNRSVKDAYEFTYTAIGTKTLTINLSSDISFRALLIMGLHSGTSLSSVKAYNGATLLSDSTDIEEQVRTLDGVQVSDYAVSMDSYFTNCDKIEIKYSDVNVVDGRIGIIMPMLYNYEISVKPDYTYKFATTDTKTRSEGGQVQGTQKGCYRTINFRTNPAKSSVINNGIVNVNYNSGIAKPLAFIPGMEEGFIFFGSQSTPFSATQIYAKKEEKWLQTLSFSLEEEF